MSWVELNAAQQGALVVYVPIAVALGAWIAMRTWRASWPVPLMCLTVAVAIVGAVALLTLLTGALSGS